MLCAEGLPALSGALLRHRCRCNPRDDDVPAHGDAIVSQHHTTVWHAGNGALLEAVRVHGAEGLLSIAPVQTPQMGAALAWISARSQLTFGSLQLEPGLHWYTLGELTSISLRPGLHWCTLSELAFWAA